MKLKLIFTAIAALLIAGTAGAQERNAKRWETSKIRIENMARFVKMDEATTEKATQAMYDYIGAQAATNKQKSTMSPEDFKAANSQDYQTMRTSIMSMLNKEQQSGYKKWLALPPAERYKKISE